MTLTLFTKSSEVRAWRSTLPDLSLLAFVPTMGALHSGHVKLIGQAFSLANKVIVSIFVNPLQFDDEDDLAHYPRTFEADLEICQKQGVTAIFAPTIAEVYPAISTNSISSGSLGDLFEGEHRRGHFNGVLTVVDRLFEIVSPNLAIFGEKDYQQLVLIRQMSTQHHPNIRICSVPTVRHADGLAISSRNTRLPASDRKLASRLFESLTAAKNHFLAGQRDPRQLEAIAHDYLSQFERISVQYVVCVDAESLMAIESVAGPSIVLLAATIGDVRLIDNIPLNP